MKGLVFELSIPKYVVAKGLGKVFPKIHYGQGSCLSLRELPAPTLPGLGWVRLRPRMAGMCGSDLATIFFRASPQLEPFNSFPAVLGHEIVADVGPLATATSGLEEGQRVAVNPLLPCRLRGMSELCLPCASGRDNGCEMTAEGCLAPGQMIGYHRDLPGGMGSELVAHPSQLHPIPDGISDDAAVLIEPLAVCVHAVLHHSPAPDARVLIIGGGPVGFATLWALRALGHKARVTFLAHEAFQLELAKQLGADDVLQTQPELEQAQQVAQRTGAHVYSPVIGPPAMSGGFDQIFDCVGNASSLQQALRYTRSFGKIVLIGAAGILKSLDLTTVWRNELTLVGAYTYGLEDFRGRRLHTFEVVIELLAKREGPDPSVLITHRFPLERYVEAIDAATQRRKFKSIKTVFDLRAP